MCVSVLCSLIFLSQLVCVVFLWVQGVMITFTSRTHCEESGEIFPEAETCYFTKLPCISTRCQPLSWGSQTCKLCFIYFFIFCCIAVVKFHLSPTWAVLVDKFNSSFSILLLFIVLFIIKKIIGFRNTSWFHYVIYSPKNFWICLYFIADANLGVIGQLHQSKEVEQFA